MSSLYRPEHAASRSLLRAVEAALDGPVPREWVEALTAVPRHHFLPERIWLENGLGGYEPCDLSADHQRWFAEAYFDVPIVTQVNDGEQPGEDVWPSSSASAPSIVVRMLRDLDVQPGMKVLEIGTGTGWNAALLAHRLGPGRVASVEVNENVARQAWANLNAAGLSVELLCGDGSLGWPHQAPYDRVVSTCAVRRVPWAWIEQTEPGGVILTPWDSPMIPWGLLRLTVAEDHAEGRFSPHSASVLMRNQCRDLRIFRDIVRDDHRTDESTSTFSPHKVTGNSREARFALGLLVPDIWTAWDSDTDRLWDEVETAYGWWQDQGSPGPERFGLTVTEYTHHAWLDSPDNTL
ncbi:methyltransferase domain-containing protein [Streptomyces sp. NRRL WC-3742]|uniref:methyltransferase domain-containing protein n=1 Tax=Streptomyces sp. NRRL WC-3742 TaxID=1463934 RepID=UPI00068FDDDE|nr:methyltransferase domain-containing protein [Streptomyces sp. NRRL WC-3742]